MFKAIRVLWKLFNAAVIAIMVFALVLFAHHDPVKFFSTLGNVVIGIGAAALVVGFIWLLRRR